ncbi:MAG: GNAT family N-acetyltransferase, partial [Xenococcaceae cyanobacterium]
MNYQLSLLKLEDERVVWKMLMYAAHESSLESVRKQPNLAQYVSNWGRDGDMGYVALLDGQPVGAAWLRLWLNQEKGFGYINDSVPELAIA